MKSLVSEALNKHAPIKKKCALANHADFVTEDLRKAIILRSRLRNFFLNEKSLEPKKAYIKQRNICVSMAKDTHREKASSNKTSGLTKGRNMGAKKVVLFPAINRVKIFLPITRWHSRMCIRIYIFNFRKQETKTIKKQESKKAKETKEEEK